MSSRILLSGQCIRSNHVPLWFLLPTGIKHLPGVRNWHYFYHSRRNILQRLRGRLLRRVRLRREHRIMHQLHCGQVRFDPGQHILRRVPDVRSGHI